MCSFGRIRASPCHQLRWGYSIMVKKIADEVYQEELQPQGQYLSVEVYTTGLRGLCIIGIWRAPLHLDVSQTSYRAPDTHPPLQIAEDLQHGIEIHGRSGAMRNPLPFFLQLRSFQNEDDGFDGGFKGED